MWLKIDFYSTSKKKKKKKSKAKNGFSFDERSVRTFKSKWPECVNHCDFNFKPLWFQFSIIIFKYCSNIIRQKLLYPSLQLDIDLPKKNLLFVITVNVIIVIITFIIFVIISIIIRAFFSARKLQLQNACRRYQAN